MPNYVYHVIFLYFQAEMDELSSEVAKLRAVPNISRNFPVFSGWEGWAEQRVGQVESGRCWQLGQGTDTQPALPAIILKVLWTNPDQIG